MPRAAAQTLDCAKIALFVDWFAQKLDAREIWKCLEHQLRTIEVTTERCSTQCCSTI